MALVGVAGRRSWRDVGGDAQRFMIQSYGFALIQVEVARRVAERVAVGHTIVSAEVQDDDSECD